MPTTYPLIRLNADTVQANIAATDVLKDLDGYTPLRAEFSVAAATAASDKVEQAQLDEARAQRLLAAARDTVRVAEWQHHDLLMGVKDQITAQYGSSSNEIEAMGRKKKNERKRAVRRASNTNA